METIKEFLSSRGIADSDIILDGTIKTLNTDSFKGWYIGNDLGPGKKRLTIEDWRTKDRQTISEGFDHRDPAIRAELEKQNAEFEAAKTELQLMKKNFAQKDWAKFKAGRKSATNKYLEKKKITELFGALSVPSLTLGHDLIIPVHGSTGEIWNYQRIQEDGFKSFVPGGRVDGLWCELSLDKEDASQIFITEGFATACSVQMATGCRTVCAFYAENMQAVAEELRKLHPEIPIILCADDDWKVKENPGRTKADLAASKVNGKICWPVFSGKREKGFTDFNDLHVSEGIEKVTEQLAAPQDPKFEMKIQHSPTIKPYINGIVPMPLDIGADGKLKEPPEFKIAKALFEYYEGKIVADGADIFIFDRTHWKLVDAEGEKNLRRQLHVLYNGKATSKKVQSAFKTFTDLIPPSTRSMFTPNPYVANFKNGTLKIVKNKEQNWTMEFGEHKKDDFCTNLIPIEYDLTRKIQNPAFLEMISRIFEKSDDSQEKVKAIRQMYGACVAPIFPHLFMLHGLGGSGKTSLIIPAMRLVHGDNIAAVDPSEFNGFKMESMAGKLLNVVTDIDLTVPITDANIKKIEDRIPIRIDRKFKTAIMAPLPAVHVFGGNDIPATYEKASGAHTRRWTFVHVEGFMAQGNYSKNFANEVFEENPQGVLNFALDGLVEVLAQNGHYFTPESGRERMRKWQMEHDSVAQFIEDVAEGEFDPLRFGEGFKVKRKLLWVQFVAWYREAYNRYPKLSKPKFYDAFERASRGHLVILKKIDGEYYFSGLETTGVNLVKIPENM